MLLHDKTKQDGTNTYPTRRDAAVLTHSWGCSRSDLAACEHKCDANE